MGQSFPWDLYRRYLLGQIVIFVPILLLCLLFEEVSLFALTITTLLFVLVQALWGLRVFSPLGRILGDPQSKSEEPAEWFELQEVLRRGKSALVSDFQEKDIYEAAFHALNDAVLVVDTNRNLKFWNKALLKLAQQDSLKGLHLEEVFRDPSILSVYISSLASEEIKRQSLTFREKGVTRHYLLTVVPLKRKSDQKTYGAVGIFSDITDIEKTEVMRMDFVANVSHELRTPLTSMKGYAQAIESEASGKDPAVEKYAQVISKSVDRLIALVNDLLDLSYIESGIRLDIGEVDAEEITQHALSQLESARKQKGQKINVSVKVEKVRGDRNRLEQVLLNLIQNAVKYTQENSSIDVKWEKLDSEVLLKVSDNGPGIDEEHLPRLFERFYRADKARSPDKGGTGLGLSIVKHIMQRHGGSVSVESQLGKGTEFTCRFPL